VCLRSRARQKKPYGHLTLTILEKRKKRKDNWGAAHNKKRQLKTAAQSTLHRERNVVSIPYGKGERHTLGRPIYRRQGQEPQRNVGEEKRRKTAGNI